MRKCFRRLLLQRAVQNMGSINHPHANILAPSGRDPSAQSQSECRGLSGVSCWRGRTPEAERRRREAMSACEYNCMHALLIQAVGPLMSGRKISASVSHAKVEGASVPVGYTCTS